MSTIIDVRPVPRSPYALVIPAARRAACLQLLAAWDARDPWDDAIVAALVSRSSPRRRRRIRRTLGDAAFPSETLVNS